jgi:hypothetical protein
MTPLRKQVGQDRPADVADQVQLLEHDTSGGHDTVAGGLHRDAEPGPVRVGARH